MNPSLLTIGQLAAHAGVTVRAIRHYHASGLLPEPARDASGYRRYDAQAVVDLIRIKTLVDAGVPLARIAQLFDAEPAEFTEALTGIDQALQAKIRQLQRQRRRVAQLTHGERLFLPASVVGILEQLRAMGISERTVQIERDAWILVAALSPKLIPEWAEEKSKALADPGFQRLYLACDQARDWDPDDPRLDQLAAQAADWVTHHRDPAEESQPSTGLSAAVSLITAQITDVSPAWRRLTGIAGDKPSASAGGERR